MPRFILIITAVIVPLFLFSCRPSGEDSASAASEWAVSEKKALAVETTIVKKESFLQGIEAFGIIEGIREADVISETSGIIESVLFETGQFVRKGDLLLTVENRLAKSSLDYARQDLDTALLEFEALEKSFNIGGASRVSYNQALTRLEAARLQHEIARDDYENTEIRAPFSGYISIRDSSISAGSYLTPGIPVTYIVDTTYFQVRLAVGEKEISEIAPASPAIIRINALPGFSQEAEVTAVSPGSSRSGGSFFVLVQWKNSGISQVKSGMSARVVLSPLTDSLKELIVPSVSIVYRNGLPYVFRVREDAAEAVEVRISRALGNRTSLVSGPEEGDSIIISGLNSLIPGDPVIAADMKP